MQRIPPNTAMKTQNGSVGASAPIGVFDSGVGGITVLNALRRSLPWESFVYLGDTARLPYGPKPPAMVRTFAGEIARTLVKRRVKAIVVACNTASAAALPELAQALPVPVWGVVEPGVSAALAAADGARVGVLGTVGTVNSRVYQERLERAGVSTWAQACPLFVPIVEDGVPDQALARLVASHYLGDRPELGAVILGCTHYPALKGVLAETLGPDVTLIDSAVAVAKVVAAELAQRGLLAAPTHAPPTHAPPTHATTTNATPTEAPGTEPPTGAPRVHYIVTGDVPTFLHAAKMLSGPEGTTEHMNVSELGAATRADAASAGAANAPADATPRTKDATAGTNADVTTDVTTEVTAALT